MSSFDTVSFRPNAIPTDQADHLLPLRLRGLGLRFDQGTPILKDLDLDLSPHGCTVIMGPNGAGKSLLLKLLHGLIAPTSGRIDWGGLSMDDARMRQALVFQKPVLLRRSVAANIDFVLRARGRPRDLCDALLQHVGLAHKARLPARRLSGGEAQRLALARALACAPDVLLLDEATASLDPASVQSIEAIVRNACSQGTRVISVTHDIGQAQRMADDVVFLHGGRVVEHGPAREFFPRPQSQVARDYLSGKLVF
ncbi:ATP-binding cassette domain-containing protein [Tritonibacter horizontis]|uniref:L-cystine import ATP-binding protein TcyC n=1 Tax=Tritonibacter horizontis TaxID=1768241 RepID=A0A132BTG9_9RHOB|nr:ATP-binding cassette domain-containing protein [Tritonibacter horizontis]KUP91506.1 L-cystine import ATP-binding protein TcyC [Tritonibacter horizontis]